MLKREHRLKDYGDAGAHEETDIQPKEAEMMIFVSVKVLNELYK